MYSQFMMHGQKNIKFPYSVSTFSWCWLYWCYVSSSLFL